MPNPRPEPAVIEWSEAEAAGLRAYLDKSPQFLASLRAKRPKMTKVETMEACAMSGKEIAGAEKMIETIKELALGPQTVKEESPFIGAGAP